MVVAPDGYDPSRSKVSADTMQLFINENVTGDLQEVPGIGPAAALKLVNCDEQITNTWMLFGKYLMLKGPDTVKADGEKEEVDCAEHNNRFWFWLKATGISAHRSAIVQAIAEKSAQFFPGIYDPRLYEEEEA
ncbi:hypothetical protein MPSEU_001085300 [Mayamaea pseudoterrestris]|nr:hypothetical protein MPSEU_001085300 [Mayamaea pseudoterrestris]